MSKSRRSQRNKNGFINELSEKELRGIQQQAIVNHNKYQKYDLDWFKPRGRQVEIMDAVEAPSSSGKRDLALIFLIVSVTGYTTLFSLMLWCSVMG